MKKQIIWGWILTGPALLCVIAIQSRFPNHGTELPQWFSPVCFYLFMYVLFMARVLVVLTRNKDLMR